MIAATEVTPAQQAPPTAYKSRFERAMKQRANSGEEVNTAVIQAPQQHQTEMDSAAEPNPVSMTYQEVPANHLE